MASQTLPLDDLELEIEGLIIDSDINNKKQQRTYGSRRCWLLCTVSISLAIVVAVLWPTHGHYVKKAADQVKNTIEGMGSNSTAQGESTGDETVSGSGGNTSDGAAESETPPITTGTSKEDVWLPAPFTVRTENPPSTKVLKEYAKTWGIWKLEDLPKMDRKAFCGGHSHCDVPSAKFPSGSWQTDQTFLPKFLEEADRLVDRAMNAILAEYGKKPGDATMFNLTYRELNSRRELRGQQPLSNGGWTTKRSMQGLARRILHAIMTRDTFTFVMGGHSAAAGHCNHFKQSYTMQFHKVMEPVFSYLGVQLVSRNLAQGGLGTVQSSLGAADIYGDEIDFLLWDSGMTEGRDARAVDMFGRQALLAHRVPVLWNLNAPVLEKYYKECDADVGLLGTGMQGMPVSKDETQVFSLPFATQYMSCDKEHQRMCNGNRFRANCWVERPDVTPPTKQKPKPGSQVKWHPGFRVHQLTGRILAFTVLTALKEAINVWKKAEGNLLPDDAWHVTAYYDNIRSKVKNLTGTSCENYKGSLPVRMCNTQMRARTEFTPRANPEKTSIRSILKTGDYKPTVKGKVLYGGPDVRNPMFDVPDGQVDVLAILNNERKFPDDQQPRQLSSSVESSAERRTASDIVPGKGYELKHPAGYCDGSYNAICKREAGNECLLYGHHDDRGGLLFHEYSGWIVMEVPKVRQGIIVVKFETWHRPTEVSIANGWKTVNNERNLLQRTDENDTAVYSERHERKLKQKPPEYCNDFHFDFAVDGKMKTYNKAEFQKAAKHIQRVVEVVTLLDDPLYVKEGEEKNVEVAVRIRGCGATKTFSLTHVYWA